MTSRDPQTDKTVSPSHDWANKPTTKDTAAATEQVLRDQSRGRR